MQVFRQACLGSRWSGWRSLGSRRCSPARVCNNDLRRRHGPRRGQYESRRRFSQPDVQISARVFKFLEIMLGHELKKLFDLLHFGVGKRRTGLRRLFAFHAFQSSMRCRGARLSTSVQPVWTATSSSMRTPPMPSAYTPGSIVIAFPGSRRRVCPFATLGSSCTSRPRP